MCAITAALLLVGAASAAPAEAQELPLTIQGGLSYGYPLGDFASTDGQLDPDITTGFATPGTNLKIRAIFGFGARITPLRIAMAAPYIQAGIGRYQSEIWQKRVNVEETDESDVQQGLSFGVGTTLMFGRFGIDIGAQYHTLEFIFDGQPIGWQATWLDLSALLTFDLGG